jgi:hypothetical protein
MLDGWNSSQILLLLLWPSVLFNDFFLYDMCHPSE